MKRTLWRALDLSAFLTLIAVSVGILGSLRYGHTSIVFLAGVGSIPAACFLLFMLLASIMPGLAPERPRSTIVLIPLVFGALLWVTTLFGPVDTFRVLRPDDYGKGALTWEQTEMVPIVIVTQLAALLMWSVLRRRQTESKPQ